MGRHKSGSRSVHVVHFSAAFYTWLHPFGGSGLTGKRYQTLLRDALVMERVRLIYPI